MAKRTRRKTPKRIKVGYSTFKLIPRSHHWGVRNKAFGTCHPEEGKICFDSTLKKAEVVNTIIHEMLHAVVYMFDINFKSTREEERVVRKMANGLQLVFSENPQFLEWVLQNTNNDEV